MAHSYVTWRSLQTLFCRQRRMPTAFLTGTEHTYKTCGDCEILFMRPPRKERELNYCSKDHRAQQHQLFSPSFLFFDSIRYWTSAVAINSLQRNEKRFGSVLMYLINLIQCLVRGSPKVLKFVFRPLQNNLLFAQ